MADVYIEESSIHGKGVFAARDFRQGEVIGIITGTVEENPDPDCEYTCWFYDEYAEEYYTVLPSAPFMFLNHDNEPNADWSTPVLVARCDIQQDDEITVHYGEEFE